MTSSLFLLAWLIPLSLQSQFYSYSEIDSIQNNKLALEGDLYLDTVTEQYYIGLSHGKLAKLFPFGGGVCDLLKPRVYDAIYKQELSQTKDLILNGYNFSDSVHVLLSGTGNTINSTTFINTNQISVNITAGSVADTFDIVVLNSCGTDTIKDGFIVVASAWKDLRNGGDAFTTGNGAGNDIRHRVGITVNRNANGMYFTGVNPWQSWVKFEACQFSRGTGTTIEWIFRHDGAFMVGISGLSTDETSGSQWQQGAVMAYFNNATNLWGFYGSSPTNGTTWTMAGATGVTNGAIHKLRIENDGSNGSTMTLFRLPSANPADWDDVSTVVGTFTSTNGNTQTPLVPFIVPRSSANNYFVAVKVL